MQRAETTGATNTLLFKSIYPTYDEFKADPYMSDLIERLVVVADSGGGTVVEVPYDNWARTLYTWVYRRFSNWEVANDNASDFAALFAERVETLLPSMWRKHSLYQEVLRMTPDELVRNGQSVASLVIHNDTEVDDPFDPLNTPTQQTAQRIDGARAERITAAVYRLNAELIREFLDKFKDLFLTVVLSSTFYG